MTGEQKQQIYILRKKGMGFREISDRLELNHNTVKTFCWRNGLSDAELERPQPNRGYNGFCKMCGSALEQKSKSRPKVFCSDKCRSLWWSLNLNRMNRKALLILKCPVCSVEFTCYPSQKKRFCGHECYIQYRYHGGVPDDTAN